MLLPALRDVKINSEERGKKKQKRKKERERERKKKERRKEKKEKERKKRKKLRKRVPKCVEVDGGIFELSMRTVKKKLSFNL